MVVVNLDGPPRTPPTAPLSDPARDPTHHIVQRRTSTLGSARNRATRAWRCLPLHPRHTLKRNESRGFRLSAVIVENYRKGPLTCTNTVHESLAVVGQKRAPRDFLRTVCGPQGLGHDVWEQREGTNVTRSYYAEVPVVECRDLLDIEALSECDHRGVRGAER